MSAVWFKHAVLFCFCRFFIDRILIDARINLAAYFVIFTAFHPSHKTAAFKHNHTITIVIISNPESALVCQPHDTAETTAETERMMLLYVPRQNAPVAKKTRELITTMIHYQTNDGRRENRLRSL